MNLSYPFRHPLALVGFCTFALVGSALASEGPGSSHLPRCYSTIAPDITCLLPVKDAEFDSLAAWTLDGQVAPGHHMGNYNASLDYGSRIQQAVYAHYGKPSDATYVLHFRVRSDFDGGEVYAALSMSDGSGTKTLPLASTKLSVTPGEWTVVELMAKGKPYAAPKHVLVEIANEGGRIGHPIQVDDVQLVESADAEIVELN